MTKNTTFSNNMSEMTQTDDSSKVQITPHGPGFDLNLLQLVQYLQLSKMNTHFLKKLTVPAVLNYIDPY